MGTWNLNQTSHHTVGAIGSELIRLKIHKFTEANSLLSRGKILVGLETMMASARMSPDTALP
jgi:hypothetical protein